MNEIPRFFPGDFVRTRNVTNAWWDEGVFLVVAVTHAGMNACLLTPDGFTWHPDWSLSHV